MISKVTGEGGGVKKNVNMTKAGNLCVFVCVCDCVYDMLMLVLGTC